jgi:hypothetical protein
MPSLRELQRGFSGALFGGGVPPWLAEQPSGFAVYRGNVLANLAGALAAVYPVTRRVVGEEFFAHAARHYALRTPSASGDIHDYGESFGDLLRELPGAADLPYLPDLARLEWMLHRVFHAADRSPLTLERVRAALEGDAGEPALCLNPACRVAAARYPVQRIWSAHQGDGEPPALEIEPRVTFLLAARRGDDSVIETLAAAEFALLHGLQRGEALETALQDAADLDPEAGLQALLVARLADGTLVERTET